MAKEYIDKAAFIEYLGFENTNQEREENIGEIVTLEDFDRQPVADVVEVVRYKDCKYWMWQDYAYRCKRRSYLDYQTYTQPDAFCSFAERRKNER